MAISMRFLCIAFIAIAVSILAVDIVECVEDTDDDNYDMALKITDAIFERYAPQQDPIMKELIEFQSISSLDEEHGDDTRRCAEWIRGNLEGNLLMQDARLVDSGFRYPVVVGSTDGSSSEKPAIVIYGHYDVQPVDPIDLWSFDPFSMERLKIDGYGEVFTGRGSSDNKGGVWAFMSALATLQGVIKGGLKTLPFNIIVVVEGEEEIGSEGFGEFLSSNKEIFSNVEFVISCDSQQPFFDQGVLMLSNRGMMAGQINMKGADIDLHSGSYGGSILNPIVGLTRILSSLHDPVTNKVMLPNFYDDVIELTANEKAELEATMGFDDVAEAEKLGITEMGGEIGYTTAQRIAVRPTVELVGIYGGFREEGIKTVLPSEAHAKVSFRLAQGQDPDKIWASFEEHVMKVAPTLARGIQVSTERIEKGAKATSSDKNSIGMKIAGEVLDEMYEKPHAYFRQGSSVNAITYFKEVLDLDTVSFGFANDATDFLHAPDERFRVSSLLLGQRSYVRFMLKLAKYYSQGKVVFDLNITRKKISDVMLEQESGEEIPIQRDPSQYLDM